MNFRQKLTLSLLLYIVLCPHYLQKLPTSLIPISARRYRMLCNCVLTIRFL